MANLLWLFLLECIHGLATSGFSLIRWLNCGVKLLGLGSKQVRSLGVVLGQPVHARVEVPGRNRSAEHTWGTYG